MSAEVHILQPLRGVSQALLCASLSGDRSMPLQAWSWRWRMQSMAQSRLAHHLVGRQAGKSASEGEQSIQHAGIRSAVWMNLAKPH